MPRTRLLVAAFLTRPSFRMRHVLRRPPGPLQPNEGPARGADERGLRDAGQLPGRRRLRRGDHPPGATIIPGTVGSGRNAAAADRRRRQPADPAGEDQGEPGKQYELEKGTKGPVLTIPAIRSGSDANGRKRERPARRGGPRSFVRQISSYFGRQLDRIFVCVVGIAIEPPPARSSPCRSSSALPAAARRSFRGVGSERAFRPVDLLRPRRRPGAAHVEHPAPGVHGNQACSGGTYLGTQPHS